MLAGRDEIVTTAKMSVLLAGPSTVVCETKKYLRADER